MFPQIFALRKAGMVCVVSTLRLVLAVSGACVSCTEHSIALDEERVISTIPPLVPYNAAKCLLTSSFEEPFP